MQSKVCSLALIVLQLSLLPGELALAVDASMQLIAPGKGWALGPNAQLFWTNDNGAHWSNISPRAGKGVTDAFFLDESHGWVLLTSGNEETNLVSFEVARTSDSGKTWAISPMKVPSQKPDELDGRAWLDFVDPEHGWAVLLARSSSAFSWGLLVATEDGGKTWRELLQAPVAGRPAFVTPRDGWLSGPAWAGRFSTHDGGKSWGGGGGPSDLPETAPTHISYGNIKFTSAKHGFLPIWLSPSNDEHKSRGTALVLYTTDDGGQTWKRDRALNDSEIGPVDHIKDIITLPGIDESVLIAAMSDKLHTNRLTLIAVGREGAVSRVSSTPPLREHDYIVQFSFADSSHGWAFTSMGNLLSTTDSGSTWKDVSPVPTPGLQSAVSIKRRHSKARLLGLGPSLVPQSSSPALHYKQRLGFDTHNAPAVDVMGTWWGMSPFFDIGIYVSGANYCGVHDPKTGKCTSRPDLNLNAPWITKVQGQGWGFFPIWVGPQAPCVLESGYSEFTSANAASLGTSNADSAAAAMTTLGLSDTVVFYDMENYNITDSACSQAVRAFLTAWVKEMNTKGFQTTAVYGNPGPAQNDFSKVSGLTQVWITVTPTAGNPPRVTIWGLGSGSNALSDSNFNLDQRAHQFLINVPDVVYGGTTADPENALLGSDPPIDYDIENLQLPGGDGTKQYVWTATQVDASSQFPNAQGVYAPAVNDVVVGTSGPAFISKGQVGQIAGYWPYNPSIDTGSICSDYGCAYAFLYGAGKFSSFSDPSGTNYTIPFGLNNAGLVAGLYCYGTYTQSGINYVECSNQNVLPPYPPAENGFLGTPANSKLSKVTEGTQYYTWLTGINDDGQAVGSYTGGGSTLNSFLYQSNQIVPLFLTSDCANPNVVGINGFSQMVGVCGTDAFLYDYEASLGIGTFIPITPPGATSTLLMGINNQGQILGIYNNTSGSHVFILDNGYYYAVPSATTFNPDLFQPFPDGAINDAAQLVGHGDCANCFVVLNPE